MASNDYDDHDERPWISKRAKEVCTDLLEAFYKNLADASSEDESASYLIGYRHICWGYKDKKESFRTNSYDQGWDDAQGDLTNGLLDDE